MPGRLRRALRPASELDIVRSANAPPHLSGHLADPREYGPQRRRLVQRSIGVAQQCVASPAAPDLTLSLDAKPAYSEWNAIQPGFKCVNGTVDHSAPTKPLSAAFVRNKSPGNVRHGRPAARVVLPTR